MRGWHYAADQFTTPLYEVASPTSLEAGGAGIRGDPANRIVSTLLRGNDIVRQQVNLDQLNERIQRV